MKVIRKIKKGLRKLTKFTHLHINNKWFDHPSVVFDIDQEHLHVSSQERYAFKV